MCAWSVILVKSSCENQQQLYSLAAVTAAAAVQQLFVRPTSNTPVLPHFSFSMHNATTAAVLTRIYNYSKYYTYNNNDGIILGFFYHTE